MKITKFNCYYGKPKKLSIKGKKNELYIGNYLGFGRCNNLRCVTVISFLSDIDGSFVDCHDVYGSTLLTLEYLKKHPDERLML